MEFPGWYVVDGLSIGGWSAAWPLRVAKLVGLRFGNAPTSAEREAIAGAARSLENGGPMTNEVAEVRNARGALCRQHVVAPTAAAAEAAPPVSADDEVALAAATPDALALHHDDGKLVGWDESAAHAYLSKHNLSGVGCHGGCSGAAVIGLTE